MNSRLPPFGGCNVLVVGDVMLDRYWQGSSDRISPEAPVPVVKVSEFVDKAGGASNVALNVKHLGGFAKLCGIVGRDHSGEVLKSILSAENIECHFLEVDELPTIAKFRVMARHQQLIRMDFEESFSNVLSLEFGDIVDNQLSNASIVVLSDYAKGTLEGCKDVIQRANAKGLPVVVDPKGVDFSKYEGATLLTPNMAEFTAVVGPCADEGDISRKANRLIQELSLKALLLTRSEDGVSLFESNGERTDFEAVARDVYDVTGAGDTVIATLATCMAAGLTLKKSVELANVAAGLVVAKVGTSVVTRGELEREVEEIGKGRMPKGVVDKESLISVVDEVRRRGETVAFTNGCFDILHKGHVKYLSEAAKYADFLIVAVNGDQSVKRLKGLSRPVNTCANRMAVLEGLGCVDWVVEFDGDTPCELIEAVKPDYLLKGGDYARSEVVGAEIVSAYGGEVKVLSLSEGCSTTNIIRRIQADDVGAAKIEKNEFVELEGGV